MDEEAYVPQISQLDFNSSMDNGANGASSASSYYNPMTNHMPPGYGNMGADMQQQYQQYQNPQMMQNPHAAYPGMSNQMPPHGMMPNQMGQAHGMMPTSATQAPQQQPAKPKRGGGRKKNTGNQQPDSNASSGTPSQQALPASYPSHQSMNPQMMQQQMRQGLPGNPYNYPMQSAQVRPGTNYPQQQYNQPYPAGYPMNQNYYAANQQQQQQYYQQQQQYPPHYPGQLPQQSRYPTPQASQYYPNMYNNYPGHAAGYPQAAQASHAQQQKPEIMASQQSYQQQGQTPSQSNPYQQQQQQTKVPPSTSMTPNSSQSNYTPNAYSGQQQPVSSQQPPNSQWPPSYNGVPPNYYQQQSIQNIQQEIVALERQYQQYNYQQQKTPEICMQMEQLYKRIGYLKQQQQQISMQQPPAAQPSPQTASNKGYPNYPSNGQVMESSNSTIPQISSASNVHHQQSVEKTPARPSTQDPNSSVSVMQTAASQVQVNITPEAPGGRTLISVYHQYPSTDVVTDSTNATTPSVTSYKDTIPPEPLPPSHSSTEQQLYPRNQQQIALSSTPSTSTINTTIMAESKPKPISSTTSSIDYPNYSQPQQTTIPTQANTSPIPPQPIPTNSSSFDISRQQSLEEAPKLSVEEKPQIVAKTDPFDEEHSIEKVENLHSTDDSNQILKTQLSTTSKNDEPNDQEEESPTNDKNTNGQQETEPFENEVDDLQPPAAPRMLSNYEEDEEDYELEAKNDEEPVIEKPIEEEKIVEEESEVEKEKEDEPMPSIEEELPSNDNKSPIQENIPVEEPVFEKEIKSEKSSKKSSIDEQPPEIEIEPSTSSSATKIEMFEKTNEESNDSKLLEEESNEAMEIPEEEPLEITPKSQPKKRPPPKNRSNRSRKSGAQSRKRKKSESEEEEEEDLDNDFVPEAPSKKRSKGKSNAAAAPKPTPIEEPKLEDFVEKRRSERNTRAERKTYSEKMDIDEAFLEAIQPIETTSVEDSPSQPAAPEWVVEKILGARIVTKMLPKEPEEDEESETTEESNKPIDGEEKAEASTSEAKSNDEEKKLDEKKEDETEKKVEENGKKSAKEDEKEVEMEEVEVEEIYVKFKGKSYLHCEWKTIDELEEIDKRIIGKINRFKAKYGDSYLDDSEYFNEDYTVVDRVLDEHIDDETGEHSAFVKWRSLPYEECTWENIEIVPKDKLKEFHQRNDVVDPYKMKERSRPSADEWEKLEEGKEYKYENTLRDYQFEGVNWLLFCWYNRQNCILADEMGLGKTVQSITFLQGIYDKGIHGPFLIVVPLSTLHNWEREFESWTDMNAIVYHGSAASREVIQNYEMFYDRGDSKKKQIVKFDALLTTYEMVVSDCEVLKKFNYRVCIIDEAHRLKNRNSKLLTGGLLSFKMEHRVLLTGTPLQNNIQELFSLLNFLEPEQFSSSDSFLEQFGQCQTEEQVQKLQDILKPMMLRRLKEDVEKTLQPKEETIIEVQLTNTQKKYYRAILERNFTHLLKGATGPSLMNVMMELRKVCNHPYLLRGAEEQIISEFKPLHPEKSEEDLQLYTLVQSAGKMILIEKLLPKLRQDGHKVLIFSQMVKVLDLLEEFLAQMNYAYERIDGNIRGDHRQAAIDRFSKPDSDRFVFLLCTRAGGLGINLTAADTVIIYDSDWNPQNDLQAQARCHRIGQTKMVKVYRLITANTYEREMFDKASLKLGLDKAVLQSMTPKDNQQQLSRKEVEDLLRKGAYGAVMEENDDGNKFNEEDIDTILQRRTQTIVLEPGIKGSTFAKASFTSSNNREDIDVNDPNFWSKWAKKANVDVDAGQNHLIVSEPRARRKRFEENYKELHQGENESDLSDDDGETSKGRNRGADFSKSRSGKKRRRDDDDDYINYTGPDELTFNKTEFFKVEKLLSAWGWGRWKEIKLHSDISLSEKDIEHIARTLLLHCIREYRGDEKSREFVWQLIIPKGAELGKGGKKGVIGGGLYHEGWATLPEFNPPAFAVDSSFQRHIHRHANKLMQRMFHLFVLQAQILGSVDENTVQNKPHGEIQLDVPVVGDPPLSNWDADCDKSFLIGIYKHGMENFETIKADPKLCFIEKGIEEMPTTIELNTRFKRIILMLSRKLEMALAAATNSQNANRLKRWPRAEEIEFMRLLRIYGVKDDHEGLNVINWNRFRELSTNLQQKTDAELLEELYCVLAMCTKQQGGELSDIDRRRASLVESIPAKQAERLMFRLHLMRKIHAIITTGIQNVRTSLKLCSNKTMPTGWGELHDEQLMIVVDMHGLDNIVSKVSKLPAFEKLKDTVDEQMLLRRIMEICTTLETGRWNGKGSTEMLDDEAVLESGSQTPVRSLTQQQQFKRNRKKNSTSNNPLVPSASPANSSQASTAAAAQALLEAAMTNPNYLLPLLNSASGAGTSSSSMQQQQLQQFQALMTMFTLSSMLPSMSDSSSSAANKQTAAALAMMMGGDDALNLTMNPKKNAASPAVSSSTVSAAKSTPAASSTSKPTTSSNDPASQFNISELLALFNIPEDTNIPVVNIENNTKLTGDKAPKLKNLDNWLKSHSNYRVDTNFIGGTAPSTSGTTKEETPTKTEKSEPSTSNGVFKSTGLEPGEIPKTTASTTNASTKTSTTEANKASLVSEMDSVKIGVFYKSTGTALSQDKWPSITNLESWLNKNSNTQVQTVFAPLAKELLPKSMHDRIGGEPSTTQASSSASNSLQQAASSAAAASLTNASLEALQVQMYLQQKLMESLNPTSYQNPYSALLGSGTSATAATSSLTPSLSSTGGLDANSAALLALFGAQLPSATTSQNVKSSTSSSLNQALSSNAALNEAALTAEILANPSLALLLNNGSLTNNNASSLSNSMASFPFNMDFNTALQLNALTSAANLGSLTQASPNLNNTSIASLLSGATTSTPAVSKKPAQSSSTSANSTSRASKLNAVVEKLASSSNLNNNS